MRNELRSPMEDDRSENKIMEGMWLERELVEMSQRP